MFKIFYEIKNSNLLIYELITSDTYLCQQIQVRFNSDIKNYPRDQELFLKILSHRPQQGLIEKLAALSNPSLQNIDKRLPSELVL